MSDFSINTLLLWLLMLVQLLAAAFSSTGNLHDIFCSDFMNDTVDIKLTVSIRRLVIVLHEYWLYLMAKNRCSEMATMLYMDRLTEKALKNSVSLQSRMFELV
ncbi:hypothetical protein BpHYR1_019937 [Brachionus plicatilis]|uniref:Uncharacterized protein n=1 Tax=Brachionus plicatilis TaxID=10195 RepID=A0A3M7T3N9_BRAPC|nr:hypothetical protein BpHYR1_019937 [Brachionus plicatilis]